MVGEDKDYDWDPDCLGPSMPFVLLAAVMFLLEDVFDGHWEQEDPASVPLRTPHAGGGLSPPPPWVVHGRPAFDRACKAVWGREEWAIVLLLQSSPAPDADESPVPDMVRRDKVPHDPRVAVTLLRDGGAVEHGTMVVYQPPRSTAVWGVEYTTALDTIKSICGCDVYWRPHALTGWDLVNQHMLNRILEGLLQLPRRAEGPHRLVVRQRSHFAAVPEEPDFPAAQAKAPPVHLLLPKEHATLLVPREDGVLQAHVPSMQALQQA